MVLAVEAVRVDLLHSGWGLWSSMAHRPSAWTMFAEKFLSASIADKTQPRLQLHLSPLTTSANNLCRIFLSDKAVRYHFEGFSRASSGLLRAIAPFTEHIKSVGIP